jgi:hypothetical protein
MLVTAIFIFSDFLEDEKKNWNSKGAKIAYSKILKVASVVVLGIILFFISAPSGALCMEKPIAPPSLILQAYVDDLEVFDDGYPAHVAKNNYERNKYLLQ